MAEFKDMLKYYRKRAGLSQSELAEKLDLGASTISMYEVGEREPNFEIEEKIADFFNIDLNTLRGKDTEHAYPLYAIDVRSIPVLGNVACGQPIFAAEDIQYVTLKDVPKEADFALIAKGDSMTGARINDGDYVFIKKQSSVNNGDIAAVLINDEVTLKKFMYEPAKQMLTLYPCNSDYAPMVFMGEELHSIQILGRAIAFQGLL